MNFRNRRALRSRPRRWFGFSPKTTGWSTPSTTNRSIDCHWRRCFSTVNIMWILFVVAGVFAVTQSAAGELSFVILFHFVVVVIVVAVAAAAAAAAVVVAAAAAVVVRFESVWNVSLAIASWKLGRLSHWFERCDFWRVLTWFKFHTDFNLDV